MAILLWWAWRRRSDTRSIADRENLTLEVLRERYFAEFEGGPLAAMLEAVAAARRVTSGQLRPHDPLDDRRGSAASLREQVRLMNLSVDWGRVLTVRQLVAAAVPLREANPTAHH